MGVKVRGAVFIPVLSPPPNIPRTRTRIAQDATKGGMVAEKKVDGKSILMGTGLDWFSLTPWFFWWAM
jgi:hypothetical protein